jgi:hypothetical protein
MPPHVKKLLFMGTAGFSLEEFRPLVGILYLRGYRHEGQKIGAVP